MTLEDGIRAIERRIRKDERELRELIVADVLCDRIRDRRGGDFMQARTEAELRVARYTPSRLEAAYDAAEVDYWDMAKSEDHEWYDEATGIIAGLQHAAAILRGEPLR